MWYKIVFCNRELKIAKEVLTAINAPYWPISDKKIYRGMPYIDVKDKDIRALLWKLHQTCLTFFTNFEEDYYREPTVSYLDKWYS